MQIIEIKISQEINFNGLPTWVGVKASIIPGEDEKDGLKKIQGIITEYHKESEKEFINSKKSALANSAPTVSLSDEINKCSTLDDLLTFKFTLKNSEEKALYEKKLSELSNNQNQ